jgi:hypothetical protein
MKNVKYEKGTLQNLEYGEKMRKEKNWESNMLGYEIRQETLKNEQDEKHTL